MLKGVEVTALRETAKALKAAGVADDAVKAEMQAVGGIVVREAVRLAPTRSGKLASTVKATGGRNKLDIVAGNNTSVKYGMYFHASTSRTTGYMGKGPAQAEWIYKVPGHTRKGYPVSAYRRRVRLPTRPFLYQAWERNREAVLEAYVTAIARLFRKGA